MRRNLNINIDNIEREIKSKIENEIDEEKRKNKLDSLEISISAIRKYNDELEDAMESILRQIVSGL